MILPLGIFQVAENAEVGGVEGGDLLETVGAHGGDDIGIVNSFSFEPVAFDQVFEVDGSVGCFFQNAYAASKFGTISVPERFRNMTTILLTGCALDCF